MILILNPSHTHASPGRSIHSVLREYCSACLVPVDEHAFQDPAYMSGLLQEYRPGIVLNCHEYSDIDTAEYERDHAYMVNGLAVKNIAGLCREQDAVLIHLSTSLVFNGSKGSPYREDDDPDPMTVYGDSKLLGERFIMESGCRHVIIRASDLFGEDMPFFSRRFVAMNEDHSLQVIKDQVIAPAYSADLAKAVSELISRGSEGIYHFSQDGPVTTGEFLSRAMELFYRYGVTEKKYTITGVEKEDFLAPGERPGYNVLDNGKLAKAIGITARCWEPALEDYIAGNSSAINLT